MAVRIVKKEVSVEYRVPLLTQCFSLNTTGGGNCTAGEIYANHFQPLKELDYLL